MGDLARALVDAQKQALMNEHIGQLSSQHNSLQSKLDETIRHIAEISDSLQKTSNALGSGTNNQATREDLDESLGKLHDKLNGLHGELVESRNELPDHLILPPNLNLRLVRADSLDRIDEYRADNNQNNLVIGLTGGSAAAIGVNWATGDESARTQGSVLLLLVLLAVTGYFSYRAWLTGRRTERIKQQMLSQ